jgi:hypothetical protein
MVGEFGRSQSQLYRELKAGKIEREISPQGEIGVIPEGHLRHIGKLPPERWSFAWSEAIATAPSKGVTTSHVAKTVVRIKSELAQKQKPKPGTDQNAPIASQNFVLGEWVEIRTRDGNKTWDGLRGPVTRIENEQVTVQLDEDRWKHLRFYRDELVKVPAPNEELNQMIEGVIASRCDESPDFPSGAVSERPPKSFYKRGDIVVIDCPASAGQEYRQWNGCSGLVKSVGKLGSVEVVVAGETMRFPPSDLEIIDNPSPIFVEVAEKVVRLLKRDDLDECERYLLMGFYLRRQTFTQWQLEMLEDLIDHYENSGNIRF